MLEAGLRSSKYPFFSLNVSRPMRIDAPRLATPYEKSDIEAVSCLPVRRLSLPCVREGRAVVEALRGGGGGGSYNEIEHQNEHTSMYVNKEWALDGAVAFWFIECVGKHTFSGGDPLKYCTLYASFGKSIQRFRIMKWRRGKKQDPRELGLPHGWENDRELNHRTK